MMRKARATTEVYDSLGKILSDMRGRCWYDISKYHICWNTPDWKHFRFYSIYYDLDWKWKFAWNISTKRVTPIL